MNKNSINNRRLTRNRFKLAKKSKSNFRLCVFRSNKHIYAQIIDDKNHKTIYSAGSLNGKLKLAKGSNKEAAFKIGEQIADLAIKGGFKEDICFDRGAYKYHGRIKEVAEGARSKGLKI